MHLCMPFLPKDVPRVLVNSNLCMCQSFLSVVVYVASLIQTNVLKEKLMALEVP
jgi:hypothetical protein